MNHPEPVTPDISVDRSSPVPLYYQVSEPMREAIASGRIPAGSLIEGEVAMAKRLGISRPTARRALQSLVDAGLLIRRRAVGTIVAPKEIHRNVELSSLYEDLERDQMTPTTKLLAYERRVAGEKIADVLGVKETAEIVEVRRLRYANGEPLALMTNYLPLEVAPDIAELENGGLYQAMRRKSWVVRTATQRIGARKLTKAEAQQLDESRGAAALTMERIGYTLEGQVIEYGTHVYRASHYSFTLTLAEN